MRTFFLYTQRTCKHIYLLLRHQKSLSLPADDSDTDMFLCGDEADADTSLFLPGDEADAQVEHPVSLCIDEIYNEAMQEVRNIMSERRVEEFESVLAKHRALSELVSVGTESVPANGKLQTQRRY